MSTTTGTPAARAAAAAANVAARAGSWLRPVPVTNTTRLSATGARATSSMVERAVGAVVAIERQRKSVRRLNRQDDRAGAAAGLARNEPRLDLLAIEKRGDEVADLIVADGGQQRRSQAEAARADADVGRAAADVGVEAADVGDRRGRSRGRRGRCCCGPSRARRRRVAIGDRGASSRRERRPRARAARSRTIRGRASRSSA